MTTNDFSLANVRINESGVEMFLGPLEAAIVRALWAGNTRSPKIWRHVREHYATPRSEEIAYTTVTSTLHRLADRGLSARRQIGNGGVHRGPIRFNAGRANFRM